MFVAAPVFQQLQDQPCAAEDGMVIVAVLTPVHDVPTSNSKTAVPLLHVSDSPVQLVATVGATDDSNNTPSSCRK